MSYFEDDKQNHPESFHICTYVTVAHNFCRVLRRLISLNQIWLPLALMLQNRESMSKMLSDWRGTNVEQICSEVAFGIKRPEFRDVMLSCKYSQLLLELAYI